MNLQNFILLITLITCFKALHSQTIFKEENALLIVEMESVPHTGWSKGSAVVNGKSIEYIYGTTASLNNPGLFTLNYKIKISNPGTYRFLWHSKVGKGTSPTDHNDNWLRIPDASAYFAKKESSVILPRGVCTNNCPNGAGSGGWFKVYSNSTTGWTFNRSWTSDNDPHAIYATFDKAGIYTVQISLRSDHQYLDRFVMFKESVHTIAQAINLSLAPSTTGDMNVLPVWSEDFENLPPETSWYGKPALQVTADGGVENSRCVRVEYDIRKDPTGSTVQQFSQPVTPAQEYTLQYDMYFESNWTTTMGGKFHGLTPHTHVTGCKPVEPQKWSSRITLVNRTPSLYLYDQTKTSECGRQIKQSNLTMDKEKWHSVCLYIKVNSSASEQDGIAEIYVNGQLESQMTGIKFHEQDGSHTLINNFFFSTFLGGGRDGTLVSKQYIRYDNFAVVPGKEIRQKPDKEPGLIPVGPEGYRFSAGEDENVKINGSMDVAFGANGNYTYLYGQTSDLTCNSDAFGSDPAPGKEKHCFVVEHKSAFSGVPTNIPGIIEAEAYDFGGSGISYSDYDEGNLFGVFRTDDVDIDVLSNGEYIVSNIYPNEWLEYTVEVAEDAYYDFGFIYSSRRTGGKIGAEIKGSDTVLFSGLMVPLTLNWNDYRKIVREAVWLPKGIHVLRINFEREGYNLDKLEITKTIGANLNPTTNKEIIIYPTPGINGHFVINKSVNWEIYSLFGSKLKEGEGNTLDLIGFSNGCYLFKSGAFAKVLIYD